MRHRLRLKSEIPKKEETTRIRQQPRPQRPRAARPSDARLALSDSARNVRTTCVARKSPKSFPNNELDFVALGACFPPDRSKPGGVRNPHALFHPNIIRRRPRCNLERRPKRPARAAVSKTEAIEPKGAADGGCSMQARSAQIDMSWVWPLLSFIVPSKLRREMPRSTTVPVNSFEQLTGNSFSVDLGSNPGSRGKLDAAADKERI